MEDKLRVAQTTKDFQEVIDLAKPICNNEAKKHSEETAIAHCKIESEAISYISGIDPLGIISDLASLQESNDSVISVLSRNQSESANIRRSADLLNKLNDEDLTDSDQLNKGALNAYSIVSLLQLRYDIGFSGQLNNKSIPFDLDGNKTTYTRSYLPNDNPDICANKGCPNYENLDFVVNELESKQYITKSSDGFNNADILTSEQSKETEDLENQTTDLLGLRNAVKKKNAYTLTTRDKSTFNFKDTTTEESEQKIQEALDKIFIINTVHKILTQN